MELLEEEGSEGHLADGEVYMFTDNSTVESCVARGSSSSPKLLDLVVRLHALSLRCGTKINVFHVVGTRMIAQGTDGVSRGYLGHGVMAGESTSAFVPIHLGANERSEAKNLVPWIQSWAGANAILLDEMGWFQQGHDIEGWGMRDDGFKEPVLSRGQRTYIWAPAPPLAAEVALAEMRKARIKRQESAHVFVCPRLCTPHFCVFGKLFDHEPDVNGNQQDAYVMACIRRVILDAFWSRARGTVEANTSKVREGLKFHKAWE